MFTTETIIHAGKTFLMLFGELFSLFIGISFVVALLHIYIPGTYQAGADNAPKVFEQCFRSFIGCSNAVLLLLHDSGISRTI